MTSVTTAAHRAHHSDWTDRAARAGLVAFGVVHLLLGWLALQLALGDREGSPDSTGALQELAEKPFGAAMVWVVGIGLALLVVWQGLEAAVGHRDRDGLDRVRKRVGSAGKAVLYAVLAVSAIRIATGSGGGGGGGTDPWTKRLMDLPAGQVLVGAVAVGILATGGYLVWKGLSEHFTKDLDAGGQQGRLGSAYVWCGKVGYAAKGVSVGLVGALFGYAALTHDPDESGCLDVALRTVLEQPFGPYLLGLIALGIVAFGVYCFAWARHLDR